MSKKASSTAPILHSDSDAVLNPPPKKAASAIRKKAPVDVWEVSLADIYTNSDVRLDATHYDQETAAALQQLKRSGYPLNLLSDLAEVRLPSQFARVWAEDGAHGIPYVNATDLMSLAATGQCSGSQRYLSRQTDVDLQELTIRAGWLLLTCSGTIGRVFYVPARLNGWVATHDLIRIIPHDQASVGFLHAYLSSPIAQKLIAGHTHGGQIDHVTHHQIGTILVPMLGENVVSDFHERAIKALNLREQAIENLANIATDTAELLNK